MKQITITIPDNCELKQDGNIYTVVEKLTYEDIAKELFKDKKAYYIYSSGIIGTAYCIPSDPINCISEKQAEKLLAINKLMNVAKYLNNGWKPNWNDWREDKWHIYISSENNEKIGIASKIRTQSDGAYFKSEEFAQKAIEILGEEAIKLVLCTDY